MMRNPDQQAIDAFYWKHGPCCSGCDYWETPNGVVGDCKKSTPVSGAQRWSMLGISSASIEPMAGHIVTRRDHVCGEFKDGFDWLSLPAHYLREIGYKCPENIK
jgi:hypothetical protein